MSFEKKCPLCLQTIPAFETLSDHELILRLHNLVSNDVGAFRNMAYRTALLTILDELKKRFPEE
jgi:hypothetical protein